MSWLVIRAFLGGFVRKFVQWLSSLSFWQIVCIACVCFAGVQTLRLWAEQRHATKVESQLIKCTEARKTDSEARNTQRVTTAERIKVVERTIKGADERAKVVESAPPAPSCRTKPEVMGADL